MAVMKPEITGTEEAVFLSSDFAGRHNNEIDFSKSTSKIGGFNALGFYDDESFYLLDTPGHDLGHLSALARATSSKDGHGKDTFILLQSPLSAAGSVKEARVNPWYDVATGQLSTFLDPIVGQRTANTVKEAFDEAENVFVAVCHDLSLLAEENGKPVLPTLNMLPKKA
ncbi:uncharacterized protein TrAFT101_004566 [Trichoderma asperellum]|uniref:uncharacterized protein n=1 Tax=Trichoderma asperellum TaxID=101201 RepID=UPI00332A5605|nr:hypothetical protein TrAFT101_004566 [Trichoderma asperellum]